MCHIMQNPNRWISVVLEGGRWSITPCCFTSAGPEQVQATPLLVLVSLTVIAFAAVTTSCAAGRVSSSLPSAIPTSPCTSNGLMSRALTLPPSAMRGCPSDVHGRRPLMCSPYSPPSPVLALVLLSFPRARTVCHHWHDVHTFYETLLSPLKRDEGSTAAVTHLTPHANQRVPRIKHAVEAPVPEAASLFLVVGFTLARRVHAVLHQLLLMRGRSEVSWWFPLPPSSFILLPDAALGRWC